MVKGVRARCASAALLLAALSLVPAGARASDCLARLQWTADTPGRHPLRAEDLIELRDFGPQDSVSGFGEHFALSPDGRELALLLRRAEVATNRYCYGLAVVTLATGAVRFADVGGEPILWKVDFREQADLDTGAIRTPLPLWSPDGRWIAYLRRDGGRTRLWRVAAAGGAAAALPTSDTDVRRFAWTADGARLVYEIRPRLEAARAAIAGEGLSGYLYDTRFATHFAAAPGPPADTPTDLRSVAADGSGDRLATNLEKSALNPASVLGAPAGARMAAMGPGGAIAWAAPDEAGIFAGAAPLGMRLGGKTILCSHAACADRIRGLWWLGPRELLFLRDWGSADRGMMELFRWRIGHAPVSILRTPDVLLHCQQGGAAIYCARESSAHPRHIVRIDARSGASVPVFDPNPQFAGAGLGTVRRLALRAADGAPAYADLVLPPGHRAGQRHPMVVVQYQTRGFLRGGVGDEYPVWLFAARGYAVLSYQRPASFADGRKAHTLNAFQRINMTDFADRRRVFTALEQGVEAAIATGTVDSDRLGITGLSEGASSALWAILHTTRYRAAALSSCCEDPWPVLYGGGPALARDVKAWGYPVPGKDQQGFWRTWSVALNADRIATPLLLQMSDQEFRLSLQAVGSLREAGKPVELYVFPGEFHTKWQPAHRAAIYRRSLDWFDFWLRGRVDPAPAKAAQYRRWSAMRDEASVPAH